MQTKTKWVFFWSSLYGNVYCGGPTYEIAFKKAEEERKNHISRGWQTGNIVKVIK